MSTSATIEKQKAPPDSLHSVVQARRIAWSTKSASNGYIYQWSRWHLTHTLVRGEKTLCGETLPFAKWITPQPGDERGDYRIKGGECQECKRLNEKAE